MPERYLGKTSTWVSALFLVVLMSISPISVGGAGPGESGTPSSLVLNNGFLIAYGRYIQSPYNISMTVDSVEVNGIAVAPLSSAQEKPEQLLPYELSLTVGNLSVQITEWSLKYQPDEVADKAVEWLEAHNTTAVLSESHDVLVPVDKTWGAVVYFNEFHRVTSIATEKSPTTDITPLYEAVVEELSSGCLVIVDHGFEIIVPPSQAVGTVISLKQVLSLQQTSSEKAEAIGDLLSTAPETARRIIRDLRAEDMPELTEPAGIALAPGRKTAVIFQPHKQWQIDHSGGYSHYPYTLSTRLPSKGYTTQYYVDGAVTLSQWSSQLSAGRGIYFNQGHGDKVQVNSLWINVIYTGPAMSTYMTPYFIDAYAPSGGFPSSFVYAFSCWSKAGGLSYSLSQAFRNHGAATYCGWTLPSSAVPSYDDGFDNWFWGYGMLSCSSVSAAVGLVHVQGYVTIYMQGYGYSDFQYDGNGGLTI
jgi:hypothetical protein